MNEYFLSHGKHGSREEGMCAMEWVAYLAGESHSDGPWCVSPTLRTFCVVLNDTLPDDQRQRLRPFLARTIGTSGDGLDGQRRWLCVDWLAREYIPAWLDLIPSLGSDAAALRALPPVASWEDVSRARTPLAVARTNAAGVDVGRKAAGGAGWDAARSAAGNAVGAAVGGEWDAVRIAARVAVRAAGRVAAWNALALTVSELQDSVLRPGGLLDRMLPMELVHLSVAEDWREVCAIA